MSYFRTTKRSTGENFHAPLAPRVLIEYKYRKIIRKLYIDLSRDPTVGTKVPRQVSTTEYTEVHRLADWRAHGKLRYLFYLL